MKTMTYRKSPWRWLGLGLLCSSLLAAINDQFVLCAIVSTSYAVLRSGFDAFEIYRERQPNIIHVVSRPQLHVVSED